MIPHFDLLIRGGEAVTPGGRLKLDIGVHDGRTAALGHFESNSADAVLDVPGLVILPGVIDTHVHFREPGSEPKEDIESGSRSAALGGVTAVFEMPNTRPPTVDQATFEDKLRRAKGRSWCDYAFFVGAAHGNLDRLGELERQPGCAGVKLFMGSSTGDLLVADTESVRRTLQNGFRRVAVHSEDEERLVKRRALLEDRPDVSMHPFWRDAEAAVLNTERLLRLARETGRRVHVLHVTTAGEVDLLARHKDVATAEVTPQHLTLEAPHCYRRLGTLAQMNPPIRDERHRLGLWRGLESGLFDTIGSDHAPHTRQEKAEPYPRSPSGMPGVQTLLPVMLDHVAAGRLSLERLVDLTSAGPARVFGIARKGRIARGYDADFTIVDLGTRRRIRESWIASRCGWSPFAGREITGWPIHTVIGGRIVMRDGRLEGAPGGRPVEFLETLSPAS